MLTAAAASPSSASPAPSAGGEGPAASSSSSSTHSPAAAAAADAAVAELRSQVDVLRATLREQQALLLNQQQLIQRLSSQASATAPPSSAGPSLAALQMQQQAWAAQRAGAGLPLSPFDAQRAAIGDRRYLGGFDARFHSTSAGATPTDLRVLPDRIILVRHAESRGNVDDETYTNLPDPAVPLTTKGHEQARQAGVRIRNMLNAGGQPYQVYFYTSPYTRTVQTYEGIAAAFDPASILGAQEDVQLREQDFGNFQDAEGKKREKVDRVRSVGSAHACLRARVRRPDGDLT